MTPSILESSPGFSAVGGSFEVASSANVTRFGLSTALPFPLSAADGSVGTGCLFGLKVGNGVGNWKKYNRS